MSQATAKTLGGPFELPSGATLKNRIMKSAMSEILGDRHHAPTDGHVRLYRTWAAGGTGLLVTGNVMVDRRALGEPGNVAIEDERHLAELRAWARAGTAHDTGLWMQLNHPGKQSPRFLSPEPVAPSAVPLGRGLERMFNTPRPLEEAEIDDIIARFATAAQVAKEAGFTGVQIHGAHGYLVSQFLSPHHNRRTDAWGGTPDKRMRFAIEVYRAIRAAVGADFPVGIKLNSADFQRGGFTEEASLDVVRALAAEGADLIEVSGGNYETGAMIDGGRSKGAASTHDREAFFITFADKVREHTDVPLAVTGGFRSASAMAGAIDGGAVDLVGLARPLAVDPTFPSRILAGADEVASAARPTTGFKNVDRLTMLDVSWYENQLARMARGAAPDPRLNAWRSIATSLARMGLGAFRQRRARPTRRPAKRSISSASTA